MTKETELIQSIYDTIFNNKQYEQFNPDEVESQQLDYETDSITFWQGDKQYQVKLTCIYVGVDDNA